MTTTLTVAGPHVPADFPGPEIIRRNCLRPALTRAYLPHCFPSPAKQYVVLATLPLGNL